MKVLKRIFGILLESLLFNHFCMHKWIAIIGRQRKSMNLIENFSFKFLCLPHLQSLPGTCFLLNSACFKLHILKVTLREFIQRCLYSFHMDVTIYLKSSISKCKCIRLFYYFTFLYTFLSFLFSLRNLLNVLQHLPLLWK